MWPGQALKHSLPWHGKSGRVTEAVSWVPHTLAIHQHEKGRHTTLAEDQWQAGSATLLSSSGSCYGEDASFCKHQVSSSAYTACLKVSSHRGQVELSCGTEEGTGNPPQDPITLRVWNFQLDKSINCVFSPELTWDGLAWLILERSWDRLHHNISPLWPPINIWIPSRSVFKCLPHHVSVHPLLEFSPPAAVSYTQLVRSP